VIRSVIFDLGGTLIDFDAGAHDWRAVEERGIAALERWLVERGHALPHAELGDVIFGEVRRGWQAAMSAQGNARLSDVLHAALARFDVSLNDLEQAAASRVYAAGVESVIRPLDGARDMLGELKARGLRLGLFSNTLWPSEYHLDEMKRFGLLEFFDATAFSCEVGLWKPNAAAFHSVTERLDVAPAEAVFVGDMPGIDIAGAQQGGLRAVWICTNGRDAGTISPDAIIRRLPELPAVLDYLSRGEAHVDR
jgi:putative hydrolase of the HAD superfamily